MPVVPQNIVRQEVMTDPFRESVLRNLPLQQCLAIGAVNVIDDQNLGQCRLYKVVVIGYKVLAC